MRLNIFVPIAVVAALAGAAGAQETYSLPANASQTAVIRQFVLGFNRNQCARLVPLSAPGFGCTQAQACTAANAAGGASCTAGQASVANARIYPDTQAGREEYIQIVWVLPRFTEAAQALPAQGYGGYCNWWTVQTTTVKDAECTKASLPTGWVASGQGCAICP